MNHSLAIAVLSDVMRLRVIQGKDHAHEGRHFVARQCAEQIRDLRETISYLETEDRLNALIPKTNGGFPT